MPILPSTDAEVAAKYKIDHPDDSPPELPNDSPDEVTAKYNIQYITCSSCKTSGENRSDEALLENVKHYLYLGSNNKTNDMVTLLPKLTKKKAVAFFNSVDQVRLVNSSISRLNERWAMLCSDMTEKDQTDAINDLNYDSEPFLILTDLPSFPGLGSNGDVTVFSYDMPTKYPEYVRRIDRDPANKHNVDVIILISLDDNPKVLDEIKSALKITIGDRNDLRNTQS